MFRVTRLATAAFVLALLSAPALAANTGSPAGSWQSTDGSARVRVTMCGDGTQLCAKLTGLSGEARTSENLGLLNTYVVSGATQADTGEWRGTIHFNGQTAEAHITMVSASTIRVAGCQLGMCKTFEFRRIGSAAPRLADVSARIPASAVALAKD